MDCRVRPGNNTTDRLALMPLVQQESRIVKDNDNLTIERPTFVTHLECAMEGDHYPADQVHNLSKAGKPLLVRYDLAGVKKALSKEALKQRPAEKLAKFPASTERVFKPQGCAA